MIPKTFKLLGHTITVVVDNEKTEKEDCFGMFDDKQNIIYVATKYKRGKRWFSYSDDTVEHTFYHELVHAILFNMGEMKLYSNERFVDAFGGMLQQYMSTKNEDLDYKRKPRSRNPK